MTHGYKRSSWVRCRYNFPGPLTVRKNLSLSVIICRVRSKSNFKTWILSRSQSPPTTSLYQRSRSTPKFQIPVPYWHCILIAGRLMAQAPSLFVMIFLLGLASGKKIVDYLPGFDGRLPFDIETGFDTSILLLRTSSFFQGIDMVFFL